ncbi:MAG: hypothetical protein ACTSUE_21880, partial [Promethearchaeota archaeon]
MHRSNAATPFLYASLVKPSLPALVHFSFTAIYARPRPGMFIPGRSSKACRIIVWYSLRQIFFICYNST